MACPALRTIRGLTTQFRLWKLPTCRVTSLRMKLIATDGESKTYPASGRLDPFPNGWFCIERGEALTSGRLIEKKWMGRDIVAWRDSNGRVCVADAICPHLGSHLGPSTGGRLLGDHLVCPFHGFRYDTLGRCVARPGGPPPRSARLGCFQVAEANGFVFAWHHHSGEEPGWWPAEMTNSVAKRSVGIVRMAGHPQVTSENSVDSAHFSYIHGYQEFRQLAKAQVAGPILRSSYGFRRNMLTRGLRWAKIEVEIAIEVWGLGISTVFVETRSGMRVRQWVLSTPVDGDVVDCWLAVDVERLPQWRWIRGPMDWLGRRLSARLFLMELVQEVKKDAEIWERLNFRSRPVLSGADRDILRFRKYCEQFYATQ